MSFCVCRDEKRTFTDDDGTSYERLFTGVKGPDGEQFGPRKLVFTSGMAEDLQRNIPGCICLLV